MNISLTRSFAWLPAIALFLSAPASSATDDASDSWKFGGELYFWGASLGGSTTTGGDIDLGIDQIVKSLKFGAMGTIAARKNDWTLFADLIYLKIGKSEDFTARVGPASLPVSASIDLKAAVSTAGVGYRLFDKSGTALDLTGGLRFLWLDSDIKVSVPSISRSVTEEDSGSNLDAVVGFRGKTELNDKWYLTYYADIGTGESDLTWQALGAVNYRLKKFDVTLGYRYLDWELNKFGPFNDLNLSGVFAGIKIPF